MHLAHNTHENAAEITNIIAHLNGKCVPAADTKLVKLFSKIVAETTALRIILYARLTTDIKLIPSYKPGNDFTANGQTNVQYITVL